LKRTRIAVIGAGHLGAVHARILSKLPGAQLVGVVDPDESARTRVAEACRTAAFADHRGLLEKLDAAVVAAPTSLHHAVGMELLDRGIHLLMEKPLALDSHQAGELVAAAKHKSAILQVGHVERFNPALTPVLQYIHDPKFIQATRAGGFTGRSLDIGVVLDLMIHDLDLALSLVRCGAKDVQAMGLSLLGGHEDLAQARIVFDNGCVANFHAARLAPLPSRTMQVWSQEGFVHIDFAARKSSAISPSDMLREGQLDVTRMDRAERETLKSELFTQHLVQEQFEPPAADQITLELEDFLYAIRTAGAVRVPGEAGRDAVALAEAVLEAMARHAWDGKSSGRVGTHALPRPHILRGPHWHLAPQPAPERRDAV
jgi:predicted dehydrogenase